MIIGITGGVGTGKSTVLNLMKDRFNAYLLVADEVGHEVMRRGNNAYDKIISEFGKEILEDSLEIDRKALGKIVFSDSDKLDILNGIIHPEVRKEIEARINQIKELDENALIVIEAALLLEAGYREICDKIIYCYADIEVRKKRLMSSRGYSEQKVIDIINNQLSEEEFRKSCDAVIDNSGALSDTISQIEKILEF